MSKVTIKNGDILLPKEYMEAFGLCFSYPGWKYKDVKAKKVSLGESSIRYGNLNLVYSIAKVSLYRKKYGVWWDETWVFNTALDSFKPNRVNDKAFNDMACDFMDKSVADLKAKFNQR